MTDLRTGSATPSITNWKAWGLRPLVLFAATYTVMTIVHELAHALTAYALRVPSTLFHFAVNIDRAHGTLNQRAVIGVAGPLFVLASGFLAGVRTHARGTHA